jgi:hypothetical protein
MSEPTGTPPPRRWRTRDSAADLLAASPVLMAVAKATGKLGSTYITQYILSAKTKQARRNATIMVAVAFTMLLLLVACVIWLAKL